MDRHHYTQKTHSIDKNIRYLTPSLVEVDYQGDYKLLLIFTDGLKKVIDFYPYINSLKLYKKYLNLDLFKKASIVCGSLVWPGNTLDFHYSTLYRWQ